MINGLLLMYDVSSRKWQGKKARKDFVMNLLRAMRKMSGLLRGGERQLVATRLLGAHSTVTFVSMELALFSNTNLNYNFLYIYC
jgi:hypothetical protein